MKNLIKKEINEIQKRFVIVLSIVVDRRTNVQTWDEKPCQETVHKAGLEFTAKNVDQKKILNV